jgi:hypothetical protein
MPAEVEAVAVADLRAREPADHLAGLEHRHGLPSARQQVGRGQSGRTAAEYEVCLSLAHCEVRPQKAEL